MNMNKPKIKLSLIIAAIVVCVSPLSSSAKTDDFIDRFAANDIIFYNPDECDDGDGGDSLSGKNTKEKVWNYLRRKGLSEAQAAGVLGNISVQSSFVATSMSKDDEDHWGLFQFSKNGDKSKGVFLQMNAAGIGKYTDASYGSSDSKIPDSDLDKLIKIQLDYAWSSYANGWQAKIQGNVGDDHEAEWAAEVFLVHFMNLKGDSKNKGDDLQYYKHDDKWQGAKLRASRALEIYKEYKGSSTSSSAKSGSDYANSDICCDTNGSVEDGKFPSTKFALSDSQVSGITAVVAAIYGGSESGAKTVASLMANLFENKNSSSIGDATAFVKFVRDSNSFPSSATSQYDESYSNSKLVPAVKDVLIKGNRTIPQQIIMHDCLSSSSSCSSGVSAATNDGKEISLSKKSEFKRGVTQLTANNTTYTFWGWYDQSKQSGDVVGYLNSNPPSNGVLNASKGSSSKNSKGTKTVWSGGWITSGLDGYAKSEATSSTLSGLDSSVFGQDYSTTSAKGSGKGPDKITIHATGSSNAGGADAIKLYAGNPYPPHFTVDVKKHQTWQHGSINKTAAAMGKDGKNTSAGVQVTLIGGKGVSGGYDLTSNKDFSDDDWKYLGEVLTAISVEANIAIPNKISFGSKMGDKINENVKKGVSSFSSSQNQVCSSSKTGLNAFYDLLVKIAHPKFYSSGPDAAMPYYMELWKKTKYGHGGYSKKQNKSCPGMDCGGFIGILLRESGWDKNFYPSGTDNQFRYASNSKKWKDVSDEITSDDKNVEPADVLITTKGHILIYVGQVPGWDKKYKYASSSLCERYPMAQNYTRHVYVYIHEGDNSGRKYHVFRRVGND